MAKRGREAAGKRARERARLEKQEAKRAKRFARSRETAAEPDVDEGALMEEFARLSARYDADQIGEVEYEDQRRRIFGELGIETDDG